MVTFVVMMVVRRRSAFMAFFLIDILDIPIMALQYLFVFGLSRSMLVSLIIQVLMSLEMEFITFN